jgi:hypothetical protein
MIWYQGLDSAPPLVRLCIDSWCRSNPDWKVIVLDRKSLRDWINSKEVSNDRSDLTVQKISNLARLCLLRRYGGVWADATVFCLRPLGDWLNDHYSVGFFAFRNPARDRLMSNWFIASEKDNPLLVALYQAHAEFMTSQSFSNQNSSFGRFLVRQLTPIFSRDLRLTTLWLNPHLQRFVRAYPYYIFHYTFNRLILTQSDLRALWAEASSLDARPMHSLQNYAKKENGLKEALVELERNDWPLQKLNWRADLDSLYWHEVFENLRATLL